MNAGSSRFPLSPPTSLEEETTLERAIDGATVYPPAYGVASNDLEPVKMDGEDFSETAPPVVVNSLSCPTDYTGCPNTLSRSVVSPPLTIHPPTNIIQPCPLPTR